MKHFITFIFIALFLSYGTSFAQSNNRDSESATITIDVGKISSKLGKAVKFVKSEVKQFKQEWDESFTPEERQKFEENKKGIKEGLEYTREAIHQGWCQGLRGEPYTPPAKKENN